MRKRTWLVLVGAVAVALLATSIPAIAAGGPPEGKGKKGDVGKSVEGFLYGDLYVIERNGNGEPYIYSSGACGDGGCAQPLQADCSYVPIMCNYVGDWTQDPELIACLIANGVEDPLGQLDPENLWEPGPCDLHPCYVDAVQEVKFGRMSVARTTLDVILKAYDEALTSLNSALGVGQDLAGRIVLKLPELDDAGETVVDDAGDVVTYDKTIDAPLENLALYREVMINACLGGVLVEYIGEGGVTVTEMHYLEPSAISLLEGHPVLQSLVCAYEVTDRDAEGWWQTPITPAAPSAGDHDLAAVFVAAAGDKEGEITLDMVVNANTYLGINPYVEPTPGQPPVLTYHEFVTETPSFDWYQYAASTKYPAGASATLLTPATPDNGCIDGNCFCVDEVFPFGAGPGLVDFDASVVPVCRGGALLANGGAPIFCRAPAGDASVVVADLGGLHDTALDGSLDLGCGGANWFTQAAEDAREVIWFLHNWKVPVFETP